MGERHREHVERLPEDMRQHAREGSEFIWAYVEGVMEERGITIEDLHERFLETGWRIPIPGRHADKPVPLEEFKLHAARAWPTPERPLFYQEFFRGLVEALGMADLEEHLEERQELAWVYVWGEPYPDELHQA